MDAPVAVNEESKRFTIWDLPAGLGLLLAVAWIAYLATAKATYDWNWDSFFSLFARMGESGEHVPGPLAKGLFTTIRISFWSVAGAFVLGLAGGLMRSAGRLLWRMLGATYVELVRNTPPLVLIFIFFYFVGEQIFPRLGVNEWGARHADNGFLSLCFGDMGNLSAFFSASLTLAVYEGAYMTEIIRAGVEATPRQERESAKVLGLTPVQTMTRIVLPQAFRRIMPPLAGQCISTVKTSSLVSVIALPELSFEGLQIMASSFLAFEVWFAIAALYLALNLSLSFMMRRLELHFPGPGGR